MRRLPRSLIYAVAGIGAVVVFASFPANSFGFIFPPIIPPGPTIIPPVMTPNTSGVQNPSGGAAGGMTGPSASGIIRNTGFLSNPTNFHQYSQTTGVGPIRGTVRIYNTFGTFYFTNGSGGGGSSGGLTGGGSTSSFSSASPATGVKGFGTGLPGTGATYNGDDPPQGVLLHVNYASLFLPNQAAANQITNAANGGSFGAFGGGGGKGGFGNGGWGL